MLTGIKLELTGDLAFEATDPAGAVVVRVEDVLWQFGDEFVCAFGWQVGADFAAAPKLGIEIPLEELPSSVLAAMNQTARRP